MSCLKCAELEAQAAARVKENDYWINRVNAADIELEQATERVAQLESTLAVSQMNHNQIYEAYKRMFFACQKIVSGNFHIGNDERGNIIGPPDGVMCRKIAKEAMEPAWVTRQATSSQLSENEGQLKATAQVDYTEEGQCDPNYERLPATAHDNGGNVTRTACYRCGGNHLNWHCEQAAFIQALVHMEALLYADHEDAYEPALAWFKALRPTQVCDPYNMNHGICEHGVNTLMSGICNRCVDESEESSNEVKQEK